MGYETWLGSRAGATMSRGSWSTWTTIGGVVLIILGLALAALALPITIPRQVPLGVMLVGIGLALAFVDALITGQISFRSESSGTNATYSGVSARLWGVNMCFAGALLFLGGAVEWVAPGRLWPLVRSPAGLGLSLTVVGLIVTSSSLIRLIGSHEDRQGWLNVLFLNIQRLFFVVYFAAGLVLLGAGLWQIFNPGMLEALLSDLLPPLPTPPPLP